MAIRARVVVSRCGYFNTPRLATGRNGRLCSTGDGIAVFLIVARPTVVMRDEDRIWNIDGEDRTNLEQWLSKHTARPI
jgi:hypothetical protein